jgi:hypothetical protein
MEIENAVKVANKTGVLSQVPGEMSCEDWGHAMQSDYTILITEANGAIHTVYPFRVIFSTIVEVTND